MTALLILSGLLLAVVGWQQAFRWRKVARTALSEATRWQGVAESRTHQDPRKLLNDIFARADGVPSTERDTETARSWRERRAVLSRDHTTRYVIDTDNSPANDGFAAHELLTFCCGRDTREGGDANG